MSPSPFRRAAAVVALSALLTGVAATAHAATTPTPTPTVSAEPTADPTTDPTVEPTAEPTADPTAEPTAEPTAVPTAEPTAVPTDEPTPTPSQDPAPAAVAPPALTVLPSVCTGLNAGSTGRIVIEPGATTEWLVTRTGTLFALSEEDVFGQGSGVRGDVTVPLGVYDVFAFTEEGIFSPLGEWQEFEDFGFVSRTVTVAAGTCPSSDELTAGTKGGFTAPATVATGGTVVLSGLPAGAALHGYLYSVPTDLGVATVAADGTLRLTIPAAVPAGTHRIALYRADGTLLGWQSIEVLAAAAPAGALAVTGVDARVAGLSAALLVAAGGALVVARRRHAAV